MRHFVVQNADYNINRNQLLIRYSNIIVPIVSMLFKYNCSIFLSIPKPVNNNENIVFFGLLLLTRKNFCNLIG